MKKKKRQQIYLRAAENIHNRKGDSYCCGQIAQVEVELFSFYGSDGIAERKNYPEFFLFIPYENEREGNSLWWKEGKRRPRILALLFAAEMCNDKTLTP